MDPRSFRSFSSGRLEGRAGGLRRRPQDPSLVANRSVGVLRSPSAEGEHQALIGALPNPSPRACMIACDIWPELGCK